MAIDEALLRSFETGLSQPVLRLYGWQPATLSLGRFQKARDVLDLALCQHDKVPFVRRITGGGVIYHADELTYSIVCGPDQIPPAGSVKDSFRVLTGFLLAFYRHLGLEAGYAVDCLPAGSRLGERTHFCFAGRETFDIMINGSKIGGNAQRRQKGLIFQHGSIPIVNRSGIGVGYLLEKGQSQCEAVTSLADLGIIEQGQLAPAMIRAFESHFHVGLDRQELSRVEQGIASELLSGKYSSPGWNLEGEWE